MRPRRLVRAGLRLRQFRRRLAVLVQDLLLAVDLLAGHDFTAAHLDGHRDTARNTPA
jgi:hypothetical protein